ncbi:MAG: energy-coupling factor ABC transporter permease [Epsilonproteobacteria bacterium]|nr:energy-coupling factor ABC transporter permease [Campylobacterota bacterium]
MHIEPGVVAGAKMALSYGTAVAVFGATLKVAYDNIKENGIISLVLKSILATMIVFSCFEILPHYPIGVSEVHLILGTTIFLVFGIAPAAIGLALGLLIQGVFFAPFDLPQYGINVTTLLASIFMLNYAAKKVIPRGVAYKDISYTQLLKLSIAWEGAIVAWVAFWAFYGQGFGAENIQNVLSFGSAYMGVVIIEPIVDMAVLAAVKTFTKTRECAYLFDKQLCHA